MGASSGGTDVIAMILKKYTSVNIGMALLFTDIAAAAATCFIFDIQTGLYAFLGLTVKSFMVDGIIENIHLCKYFTVVCNDPEPICHFIIHDLNRSATKVEATGAFSGQAKHIINTVLSRTEAVRAEKLYSPDSALCFCDDFQHKRDRGKRISQYLKFS